MSDKLNEDYFYDDQAKVSKYAGKLGDEYAQEQYVKKNFFQKMKKVAGKVKFAREAVALYYCAMDSKTPLRVKVIAMGALAYLILPTDILPDIFLGIGYVDDLSAIMGAYKAISAHITDEHREQAQQWLNQ